jgi:hypothetical protein
MTEEARLIFSTAEKSAACPRNIAQRVCRARANFTGISHKGKTPATTGHQTGGMKPARSKNSIEALLPARPWGRA